MDKIVPIRRDEVRQEMLSMHDRALRRQLQLSVIVVVVLLVATIGAMLSMRPVHDHQSTEISSGGSSKVVVSSKAAG